MRRLSLLFLPLFVLVVAAGPAARPTEEKENHPDGTLHFRVPLNAKGQRHGTYTAYFPGGKKLIEERAVYDAGELYGPRERYDDKGNVLAEETWVRGRLICPKSTRQIEAARAQLLKDAAAWVTKAGRPPNPNAPSAEALARALAKVNTYRYLCDVPADVVLDNDYINLCQSAAELLVKVGSLTHNPPRPAGVSDDAYRLGKDGCGRSNLFMGGDSVASVDGYMNDSDRGNIDRVGHRRWILNPRMAKTGFGGSGKFSAMYSFDVSRAATPDYDFACYPPRGYCPVALFNPGYAWHVSLNPEKYTIDDSAEMAIYPVDAKLNRAKTPLELDYKHVDRGGFGIGNAIIGRPKNFALRPGLVVEVVLSGVQAKDGAKAEVSYFVTFY